MQSFFVSGCGYYCYYGFIISSIMKLLLLLFSWLQVVQVGSGGSKYIWGVVNIYGEQCEDGGGVDYLGFNFGGFKEVVCMRLGCLLWFCGYFEIMR